MLDSKLQRKRRRKTFRAALAPASAAALCAAALFSPHASSAATIRDDVPDSQYTNLSAQPQFAGVSGYFTVFAGSFYNFGSGTLIAPDWILTAAHVVTQSPTGIPYGAAVTNFGQGTTYVKPAPEPANNVVVEPGWNFDLTTGVDLALIQLSTPITNVAPALLYNASFGSEIGQTATIVGYGLTGTGLIGDNGAIGTRRAIQNTIDAYGGANTTGGPPNNSPYSFAGLSTNLMLTDFDRPGVPSASVMGGSTALPLEGASAPGDSGGGLFINVNGVNYLAGVTDFIGAFGDNALSTSPDAHYGDYNGYTRVDAAQSMNFILSTLVTNSSWNQAGGGTFASIANWTGSNIPEFAGATGNFGSAITADSTINLDDAWTVGTLTFANTHSYTLATGTNGSITLDSGTVAGVIVNTSGNHFITAPLALNSNAQIAIVNSGDSLTFTGGISGPGSLTKLGQGRLVLGGAGAYSGPTFVNGGLLELQSSVAIAASPYLSVSAGGAAGVQTGSTSDAGFLNHLVLAPQQAGAFALAASDANINIDYTGTVAGAFNMAQPVAGNSASLAGMSLGALSSGLTYTGTITPASNRYQLGGGGALTVAQTSAASVPLVDGSLPNSVLIENGGSVILPTTNTYTGSTTIQGNLITTNPLTGATALQTSVLQVSFLGDPGSADGSSIGNSDPTNTANLVINGGTLRYSGGGDISSRLFTIGTLGATVDSSGSGALNLSNTSAEAFSASSSTTLGLTGSNSNNNVLSATLADPASGQLALIKSGSGFWNISGANTYSGGTTINAGTLQLGNASALGAPAAPLSIAAGAILDLNAQSVSFGLLTGSGTINNSGGGTPTITVGLGNVSGTFAGLIQNGTGLINLVKVGSGTITLSGTGLYTGGTSINAGTLAITSDAAINYISPTFSGGVLQLDGYSSGLNFNNVANLNLAAATGNAATLAGVISGTSQLTYSGPGTLILSNLSNSFTGGIVLNGGELSAAAPGDLGGGTNPAIFFNGGILQVTNAAALANLNAFTVNGATGANGIWTLFNGGFDITDTNHAFTIAQSINGIGALTKLGAGALVLGGVNGSTFTGGTSILAGSIKTNSASALGGTGGLSGAVNIGGGASLDLNGQPNVGVGILAGSGTVLNSGTNTAVLTVGTSAAGLNQNASCEFDGSIINHSGSGTGVVALTKAGLGTFTLSAVDSYSGPTIISAGTLLMGNSFALGSTSLVTVGSASATGTLDLNGSTITIPSLVSGASSAAGSGAVVTSASAANLIINNSAADTYGGSGSPGLISGAIDITKNNTGKFTLASANTFTNGIAINAGVLSITNPSALGSSSNSVFLNAGALLDLNDFGAVNNAVVNIGTLTGAGTLSKSVAGGGNSITTLAFGNGNANSTFAGVILNTAGTLNVQKVGSGTITLTGSESINGVTSINGGELSISTDSNIGGSSSSISFLGGDLQITGNAITNLNSHNVNWSTFNGGIDIASAGNVFTVSTILQGSGSFTKLGAGTLLLTGSNQTALGTNVNGGILAINGDSAVNSGPVTFNGGTLEFNNFTSNLSFNNAPSLSLAAAVGIPSVLNGAISGNSALNFIGPGTLSLTATNTHTAGTTLAAGELSVAGLANLGSGPFSFTGGTLQVTGTSFQSFGGQSVNWSSFKGGFDINNAANIFTVSNSIGGSGSISKLGPGTLILNGNNSYSGGTNLLGGEVIVATDANLGGSHTPITFNGGTLQIASTILSSIDAHTVNWSTFNGGLDISSPANTVTVNSAISGSGALSKLGAGTLVLAAANTYGGGTTVSQGVLQLGSGGVTGSAGSSTITDNASLVIKRSDSALTFSNSISGTGSVSLAGSGTVTFTGSNTYSGPTTINAGALAINSVSALPAGNTVIDNSVLNLNTGSSAAPLILNNAAGTGALIGSGILNVGTASKISYVQLANGSGTSSVSALNIAAGSSLDLTKNSLAINFGSPANDPTATIRGYISSAYHNNSWQGTGLTSSAVEALDAANAGSTRGTWSLGYADGNVDTQSPIAQANQLVIRPALAGDALFLNQVSFADLLVLAQNLGSTNADWEHADFNYDQVVDFKDLLIMAQNFNQTNGITPLGETLPASFEAQLSLAQAEVRATQASAPVPEPAALTLAIVSAAGLLTRRRRRTII